MITIRSLLEVVAALAIGIGSGQASAEAGPLYTVVTVGNAHIAVPAGWRNLDRPKRSVMYRQGDGIGVPLFDETESPLQIGLALEKLPSVNQPLNEIMSALIAGAKRDGRLQLVGAESVETLKLVDGAEALLLKAEFLKEGSRRSLQMKLLAKDAGSDVWMASAHLVGGKDSSWPRADSRLAAWLEAHLTSLAFNEKKVDTGKLEAAYVEHRRLTSR